jgi:hypothetical protein
MVWNKQRQDPQHVSSYPTYDMAYMGRVMTDVNRHRTKYGAPAQLDTADKMVYMQKAAADLKAEADEALQAEFALWLQGKRHENVTPSVYDNSKPGVTERRQFMNGAIGPRNDWKSTWWGRGQLTHLPGVRDYLRSKKIAQEQATLDLNQLAELGPQSLDQAWTYFKAWVKGMPQSESVAVPTPVVPEASLPRPTAGPRADHHFRVHDPYQHPYGGKPDEPMDVDPLEPKVKIESAAPSSSAPATFDTSRMENAIGAMGNNIMSALAGSTAQPAATVDTSRMEHVMVEMARSVSEASARPAELHQQQQEQMQSQHAAIMATLEARRAEGNVNTTEISQIAEIMRSQHETLLAAQQYRADEAERKFQKMQAEVLNRSSALVPTPQQSEKMDLELFDSGLMSYIATQDENQRNYFSEVMSRFMATVENMTGKFDGAMQQTLSS